MTDMLQIGVDWLNDTRNDNMTTTVNYARGALNVDISATIGRTVFEIVDEYGKARSLESKDFIIRSEDLQLGGLAVTPEPGDTITQTAGTTDYIYEVLQLEGEPHFRYSDGYMLAMRIHTKLVG